MFLLLRITYSSPQQGLIAKRSYSLDEGSLLNAH